MRIGMKMRVVVNRVRPNSGPAIAPEGLTKSPALGPGVWRQGASDQYDRQRTVRLRPEPFGSRVAARGLHRNSVAPCNRVPTATSTPKVMALS